MDGILIKELVVQEEYFHFANHRIIFLSMKKAAEKGELIDVVDGNDIPSCY
ncbi:DnaB-like helicase N-terminal domain-containing protein [Paucisalibacillus sp. EB02]|uniref:DnaB-like helicase N-terminal domain-containing protein n=1 Tax=Paucisalibacillus sp. EB02 TaxID=1347087 RepID=UPI0009DF91C7